MALSAHRDTCIDSDHLKKIFVNAKYLAVSFSNLRMSHRSHLVQLRSKMLSRCFRGDWATLRLSTVRRVVVLLSVAAVLHSCAQTSSEPANPTPPKAVAGRLPVAFTMKNAALSDPSWPQLRGLLQPGDFVYYNATGEDSTTVAIPNAQQIAQSIPGIHVVYYERDSLNTVIGGNPAPATDMAAYLTANPLPAAIEYVAYDWEPLYMPEFAFCEEGPTPPATTCGTIQVAGGPIVPTTIDPYPGALYYFGQAVTIAGRYGKKLYPTPFNPYRSGADPNPWNQGAVAQVISVSSTGAGHAMDVQTQGDIKPGDLSTFQQHVQAIASDVRSTTPALTLFFEISYNLSNATDVLNAALWVQENRQSLLPNGTTGVFVIYTNLSQVVNLLQAL